MIRLLAEDTDVWADDTWLIDSTPVECGRSVPTTKRSQLAGWAGYGYCASHSRFFWGLRLHLVCTPAGLPITFAVANPKLDERDVAIDMFDHDPSLLADRAGQTLIADKGYVSAEFERRLADHGVELVRPARTDERPRRGARQLRSFRQIIESVNDTLKGQLSLEHHGGHSPQGVTVRILQRLLALTAAIWHNHHSQPTRPAIAHRLVATHRLRRDQRARCRHAVSVRRVASSVARREAPGEMPTVRLKARLNAASDS